MKNRLAVVSLICLATLYPCSVSFGDTLRGRLEKFGKFGILPASYMNVSLCKEDGVILETEVSDADGTYLFGDVKPGVYLLKIWVKGFENDPISQEVEISGDTDTTVASTILIHRFTFESPKEQSFSTNIIGFLGQKIRFVAYGSQYALPENAIIWPILKCLDGNYLVSTEKPLKVNKNGKWISREIIVDRSVEEILAVLVTKAGDHRLRWHLSSNEREFLRLPENSYILARRRLIPINK